MFKELFSIFLSALIIITSTPSLYAQDTNFQTRDADEIVDVNALDNELASQRQTTDSQTALSSSSQSQELVGQYAEQIALTYSLVEYLDQDCEPDPIYREFVPSLDMLGNNASFQQTLFEATRLKKDVAQASAIDAELGGCLLYTSPSPRDQRGSRMPSSA